MKSAASARQPPAAREPRIKAGAAPDLRNVDTLIELLPPVKICTLITALCGSSCRAQSTPDAKIYSAPDDVKDFKVTR